MLHQAERWVITAQENKDLCMYGAFPFGENDIGGDNVEAAQASYRRGEKLAKQMPYGWGLNWNSRSAAEHRVEIIEDTNGKKDSK